MASEKGFSREANGLRFDIAGGMNTVLPPDLLPPGRYPYLQNVRRYLAGRTIARAPQNNPVVTLPAGVTTMARLNDTSPAGPVGGYVRVYGAAGVMYVNAAEVLSGLSGNPLSFVPYQPASSPQPWLYTGDPNGMWKVRSDGTVWKVGIAEPQVAPTIGLNGAILQGSFALLANAAPWTNYGDVNPDANYGETSYGGGGTDLGPGIIGNLVAGASLQIVSVTGTATVNGATHAPGDAGPSTGTYPGAFVVGGSPKIILGAFTDASGNIVPTTVGGSTPAVYNIGAGATLTVPPNAVQFQIGVDSSANTFYENSGNFTVNWKLTIAAAAPNAALAGDVIAYYWGDSPHSGPVAGYIWKNAADSGSGTIRTTSDAAGSASGNSLLFDWPTTGVNTNPVEWTTLNSDGSVAGSIVLFDPPLESAGYQDFNACVVANIFIPQAGAYTFQFNNKDQIMVGIGGGATGPTARGTFGQTMSVVNGLPLMYVSAINGEGGEATEEITVTFPSSGIYPIEIDWDYWYHAGRSMGVLMSPTPGAGVANIPPLEGSDYHVNATYRYRYRSSQTGARSNPSPASNPQTIPLEANAIGSTFSTDPQVDLVDYFRQDEGLDNYTYVGAGPNDNAQGGGQNTPILDTLSDAAVLTNELLSYDLFEPFPSVDMPAKGVVNVGNGGEITWVSGAKFNTRWLPGTIMLIGFPASVAYSTIARPTSTTAMVIPGVPSGNNLNYEIAAPLLAAQPSPVIWGPTPNAAFMFGLDPNNPGWLVWTNGNDFDSAADTNRMPVTSPGEPLMNGIVTAEINLVFSTERYWLIYPNFQQATATVTGIEGQPWTLIDSDGTRGLYIRNALCSDGGAKVFFRAKDCIALSEGGGPEKSITEDIYNLFPHENFTPQPITLTSGVTVYPPDDTKPNAQTLTCANGYLYYDYQDTTGTPRTLVYDMEAEGWIIDIYAAKANCHLWEIGPGVNQVLTGCTDGGVRPLGTGGSENMQSLVATPSINAGDARAMKLLGDVFFRALATAGNPFQVELYMSRYATPIGGTSLSQLTGTGALLDYLLDFSSGDGLEVDDIAATLTWPIGNGNVLDLWQPNFLPLPETVQDRPTDWDDCGNPGNKFIQGLRLELNTLGQNKSFQVQRSDDGALFTPNEVPVNTSDQTVRVFTFTPPFLAHNVRIVATDGVPWRRGPDGGWDIAWTFQPFPEATVEWQTENTSHGLTGWQHLRAVNIAYQSTTAVTLTITFDQWPTITITLPSTGGVQTKYFTGIGYPPPKFKLASYRFSAASPFYLFAEDSEVLVKAWGSQGPFQIVKPFGGASQAGADI